MKSLEQQHKAIKNDYGEKISTQAKSKLDRCLALAREMCKCQIIRNGDEKDGEDRVVGSLRAELGRIRGEIEGEWKLGLTDYQAYLWKLDKISHRPKPPLFTHLTPLQQSPAQPTTTLAKTNPNIPLLSYRLKDLIKLGSQLLLQNKHCQQNHNSQTITKLLTQISANYNILPYHNFTHAFSVFVMLVQCMAAQGGAIGRVFGDLDCFVGGVAALCHDLGHRGTNSGYQIKRKTAIAVMYNYESVLENMHIAHFYRLCKEHPELDVIGKIKSPVQRQNAKRLFNRLILATDVQGHSKNLKKLQSLPKQPASELSPTEKQTLFENLFHACDVGNPCLNFPSYMNWSLLICQEFNLQVERERAEGLEVTPGLEFVDLAVHYQRQIGFIDFLVMPVWKELTSIFPQLELFRKQIEQNRQQLQQLTEK